MEIYLVRHGKTPWNAKKLLQGRTDIELNEEGRQAALRLGEELKDTDFDCIYSSPLKRAYETALLIRGNRDIPIYTDDRLLEMSFGHMEGTDAMQGVSDPANPFYPFFHEPEVFLPPRDGESLEEIRQRADSFIKEVLTPLADHTGRVLVTGHGAINAALGSMLEGRDIAHFWGEGLQGNCQAQIYTL